MNTYKKLKIYPLHCCFYYKFNSLFIDVYFLSGSRKFFGWASTPPAASNSFKKLIKSYLIKDVF